jgi:hypothetical protein
MNHRSILTAIAAGVASGVLATAPLLGFLLNCLCCASVWGSAAAVVWLEARRCGARPSLRDSALLGLVTGLVSGIVAAAFIALLTFDAHEAAEIVRQMDVDVDLREATAQVAAVLESGIVTAVTATFTAVLHAGVGVLGGLLGAALTAADNSSRTYPAS